MKITLTLCISLVAFLGFSQSKMDCDKIKTQVPHFVNASIEEMKVAIDRDLETIRFCLDMDSIDQSILIQPPFVTSFILEKGKSKEDITFSVLFEYIEEFRSKENYAKIREAFAFMMKYEAKEIDPSDSIEVRKGLELYLKSEEELELLMAMIFAVENANSTYEDVFTLFKNRKTSKPGKGTGDAYDNSARIWEQFSYIESLKQLKASSISKKRKLIYFTGFADVNSRYMEQHLFPHKTIVEGFKNFDCYYGHVDSKSEASNEQKAEFENLKIETQGQFISAIEKMLFPKNYQPIFIIVDENFKVIDTLDYTSEKDKFIAFLEKNK